jgi:hypothetical protein
VSFIVNKQATAAGVSPEGLPVVPVAESGLRFDDLIVLSSEVFEGEMWSELAEWRQMGGCVLGLYDDRRVSRSLWKRLTPGQRRSLGRVVVDTPNPSARPRLVCWDARRIAERWSRLSWIEALAGAAESRGLDTLVVTSTQATPAGLAPHCLPDSIDVAPLLDLDGRDQAGRDPEGGLSSLTRLSDQIARSATQVLQRLALTDRDVVVFAGPGLAECLALPRALRALPAHSRPNVILHGVMPTSEEHSWAGLPNGDLHVFYRYAVNDLRDAVHGRLGVTFDDKHGASTAVTWTGHPIHAIGYPIIGPVSDHGPSGPNAGKAARSVLCFGHIGNTHVRPLLDALLAERDTAGHDWRIIWRSAQGDGPLSQELSWAHGVAHTLPSPVELIDSESPAAVRDAIASASMIVVLSEQRADDWPTAVCAHAAHAGVPVVAPIGGLAARYVEQGYVRGTTYRSGDAQQLVSLVRAALPPAASHDRGAFEQAAPTSTSTLQTVPSAVFERLLQAVEGGDAVKNSFVASGVCEPIAAPTSSVSV